MRKFVPAEASVLLEVGCGAGAFARSLKDLRIQQEKPLEVWGVEVDEDAAEQAKRVLDRVLFFALGQPINRMDIFSILLQR